MNLREMYDKLPWQIKATIDCSWVTATLLTVFFGPFFLQGYLDSENAKKQWTEAPGRFSAKDMVPVMANSCLNALGTKDKVAAEIFSVDPEKSGAGIRLGQREFYNMGYGNFVQRQGPTGDLEPFQNGAFVEAGKRYTVTANFKLWTAGTYNFSRPTANFKVQRACGDIKITDP